MQYVYVLQCKGGRFYTGYSSNLKQRLKQHRNGEVISTRNRLPVELVYYETCTEKADAKAREKYLKSTAFVRSALPIISPKTGCLALMKRAFSEAE